MTLGRRGREATASSASSRIHTWQAICSSTATHAATSSRRPSGANASTPASASPGTAVSSPTRKCRMVSSPASRVESGCSSRLACSVGKIVSRVASTSARESLVECATPSSTATPTRTSTLIPFTARAVPRVGESPADTTSSTYASVGSERRVNSSTAVARNRIEPGSVVLRSKRRSNRSGSRSRTAAHGPARSARRPCASASSGSRSTRSAASRRSVPSAVSVW